jgi:hypothetical protein
MRSLGLFMFRSIRLWVLESFLRLELLLIRHALRLGFFGKGTSDRNILRIKPARAPVSGRV